MYEKIQLLGEAKTISCWLGISPYNNQGCLSSSILVIDYGWSKREILSYPSVRRVGKLVGGQVKLSAPMNPYNLVLHGL